MKKFARRAALSFAALVATVGVVALPAPAEAIDTGWGCGGACRVIKPSN